MPFTPASRATSSVLMARVSSSGALLPSKNSVFAPARAGRIASPSSRSPLTAVTPAGKPAVYGVRVSARTFAPLAAS